LPPSSIVPSPSPVAKPRLFVGASNIDFGTFTDSYNAYFNLQNIQLRNTGNAPLDIGSVVINPPDGFKIVQDCSNIRLQPNSDPCVISIAFDPASPRSYDANLVIPNSAGDDASVSLRGSRLN
jgi:hypothetical protein